MGLKHRIHPLAAALACDQLPRLDQYLAARRTHADHLITALTGLPGLDAPAIPSPVAPSWYALALTYAPPSRECPDRDTVFQALAAEGCSELDRPGSTRPLNEHPLFARPTPLFRHLPPEWPQYREGQFPVAERLHRSTLKLTVPHANDNLVDDYIAAFRRVPTHPDLRRKEPAA